MKIVLIITILSSFSLSFVPQSDFLSDQRRYKRVRTAIEEKEREIEQRLADNGVGLNSFNMLIVAYKAEDELELYAQEENETEYILIDTYTICSKSGTLGPKRRQGDSQVPEGVYHIDRFNPSSNFYLSLGINYPNQADRRKSKSPDMGGNIFIHGACVTIGCLPMTNDKIKELYLYAVHAKNNGQAQIPVYIFPFKMTNQNFSNFSSLYNNNNELIEFWTNLKSGYDKFVMDKSELEVKIAENGDYQFFIP